MDWSRGHTVGHGASATVSLATSPQSGDIFAVKSAELSLSDSLQREGQILSSLNSPYIVGYRGCDITTENNKVMYNLFMEYVPHGTLSEAIRRQGGRLSELAISFYIRPIVQGIEYLHSNCLVHCDIKGSNILVGEDGPKVADLGCARQVFDRVAPIGGTPMYMAPEVARGEGQGYACDIWAVGCTIIEMATGFSPWPNAGDPISILYRIGYSDASPEIPCHLSEKAKDFLDKCLKRDPKQRWTASQLLNHSFLVEAKQIKGPNSVSPTSVLDKGFWSSMEETESIRNVIVSGCGKSPVDRIRRLGVSSGEASDWTMEEDWITARGSEEEDEVELGDVIRGPETPSSSC